MMLTGARISSCAAWQLLQVSRHVASRRAVAARRSAFSWTVMFAPGPIRVLRTTRAPCIAAFGNLEPARAALLLLLRARRQRRVAMAATARARSVAPQPPGRCHESQSVASTAQQTRTAPHRKSARTSWDTVELICRRRFSTKNLRRYTVRVTRSPPCSVAVVSFAESFAVDTVLITAFVAADAASAAAKACCACA